MLLGQVEVEKRFTELDEQEQRNRLNEDMVPELEYAFDTEDEVTGDSAAGNVMMPEIPASGNAGIPESFAIGDTKTQKPFAAGSAGMTETPPGDRRGQQPPGREDKAADSISYRMFHWKFTVEQKEEIKRAMAVRVPKDMILSNFYPETSVVRMMEIRRRYE